MKAATKYQILNVVLGFIFALESFLVLESIGGRSWSKSSRNLSRNVPFSSLITISTAGRMNPAGQLFQALKRIKLQPRIILHFVTLAYACVIVRIVSRLVKRRWRDKIAGAEYFIGCPFSPARSLRRPSIARWIAAAG
ncbi:MAG: hypothetical protein WAU57_11875 [Xanthobacteraceae bacterium]